MRTLMFLFALLFSHFLTVGAQNHKPLLTDGKEWKMVKYSTVMSVPSLYYTISVGEEVMEYGKLCRRMYVKHDDPTMDYTFLAYEDEKGKVYDVDKSGAFILQLDLSLRKGDEFYRTDEYGEENLDLCKIVQEETISVKGRQYRRLLLGYANPALDGISLGYWVEGIGTEEVFITPPPVVPTSGSVSSYGSPVMLACYENGECIFEHDDFQSPSVTVGAQNQYKLMLTDGKVWKYRCQAHCPGNPFVYYTETVGEVVEANGKLCRRIYVKYDAADLPSYYTPLKDYTYLAYEEDGRLYKVFDTTLALLLDFTLHEGDEFQRGLDDGNGIAVEWVPGYKILEEDSIMVKGKRYRRLKYGYSDGSGLSMSGYWVEGIGASDDASYMMAFAGNPQYTTSTMVACYENGECIFEHEDFHGLSVTVAQNRKPLLTDGKAWKMVATSLLHSDPPLYYTINVGEEVMEYGKLCRRMYVKHDDPARDYTFLAYEDENGRVYDVDKSGECILKLDFSLRTGDEFYRTDEYGEIASDDLYKIAQEDTISVKGRQYRRLLLGYADPILRGISLGYWVEGIGTEETFITFPTAVPLNYNGSLYVGGSLIACYENGECIFEYDDFHSPSVTGVTDVKAEHAAKSSAIYNLNGQRVSHPRK
ncbi:MAG: hypothetical protein Q4D28_08420, partial [Prevotellaceae bacterium]|nr:hypothetical protein [Prevotellaceae bacterium]